MFEKVGPIDRCLFCVCRVSQDDKKKVYLTDEINIGEVPCKINLVAEVDGLSLFLLAYKLVYYTESTRKLYVLAMDLKAEKVVSAAGFAWLQRATIRNPTSAETVKAGALTQDTECGGIHLPMHGASHATSSQNPQETQEALNAPRRSKRKKTATENDAHVPHKPVAPRKVKKTKRPSEVSSELAEPVIDDVMAECKHCF